MSMATAAHHCPTELQFVDADDRRMTVTFRSASYSQPGAFHTTTLALLSGSAECSCFGTKKGECWHQTLIRAAWEAHEARSLARRSNGAQLLRVGAKASNMIRVYRKRCWATLPADRVTLVATRQEWLERAALAEAPALAA